MPSRRDLLSSAGSLGIAALAGCTALTSRDPDLSGDWRQVGRDWTNRNYAPEMTLPSDLAESWRGPIGSWPYVPPVVADGTVYVAGSRGVFALDADDGAQQWHRKLDGDVAAGLAVDGDTLLVPEYRSNESRLRAFTGGDGDDRWTVALESRPFAPSVRDRRIYLRTRDACIAIDDGELDWRTELDRLTYDEYNVRDTTDFTSTIAPAVTPGGVVVPDRNAVTALDLDDGAEHWRVELHASMASPVVTDERILAVGLHETIAIDRNGTERWRSERGGWATVAAADSVVYLGGRDELTALALGDGREVWNVPVAGEIQRSQAAVLGDAVLTAGDGGVALRRADPGLLGNRELFRIPAADHGGVTAGGGRVFAVDRGDLVAYEPSG